MTNDLDAITAEWLQQCGPHDYGILAGGCACPDGDFRPVMYALVNELRDARATLVELAPSKLADQVERLKADRRALDIAVTGLRELEDHWGQAWAAAMAADDDQADVYQLATEDLSRLLDKIGGTR